MKQAIKDSAGIRVAPDHVLDVVNRHMLVDGFPMVIDLEQSKGSRLVDVKAGKTYLDFFMFFASVPIGFNHSRLLEEDFTNRLAAVAVNKPSNSTVSKYSSSDPLWPSKPTDWPSASTTPESLNSALLPMFEKEMLSRDTSPLRNSI